MCRTSGGAGRRLAVLGGVLLASMIGTPAFAETIQIQWYYDRDNEQITFYAENYSVDRFTIPEPQGWLVVRAPDGVVVDHRFDGSTDVPLSPDLVSGSTERAPYPDERPTIWQFVRIPLLVGGTYEITTGGAEPHLWPEVDYTTEPPTSIFPATVGIKVVKQKVAFSAYPVSGVAPLDVHFTGIKALKWEWDFGDGSPVEVGVQNPTHRFEQPGLWVVTLTVNGDPRTTSQRTIEVLPPEPPPPPEFSADFAASPSDPANPLSWTFTDLSNPPPRHWQWEFGDGSVSGEQNPTHVYATDGTYEVTLTIENGASRTHRTILVEPDHPPVADAGPDVRVRATGPEGALVSLDGSRSQDPEGQPLSFAWRSVDSRVQFDPADAPLTRATFPLSDENTTLTVRVELTVTDPAGNESMNCVMVTVENEAPVANAGADQRVLSGAGGVAAVTLDGTASVDLEDGSGVHYEWCVPDNVVLNDTTAAQPVGLFPLGTTTATLVVTDRCGAKGVSDVVIEVYDDQAPLVAVTTDIAALLPPNHRMTDVEVLLFATDNASMPEQLLIMCEVTSSEPDDAGGDGNFIGDVDGQDGHASSVVVLLDYDPELGAFIATVPLRAERNGGGEGRRYSIVCTVSDLAGNVAQTGCVVVVPHDRGKRR